MKISHLKKRIKTISPGQRFGHFMIDMFVIGMISYIVDLIPSSEVSGFLDLLIFPAYYILFEFYLQWTPGKYITNTVVVNDFGEKPDIQTVILRTFIRFIPFEPFSCTDGYSWGWHDKWTKTYVIKKEQLGIIREQLGVPGSNDYNENISTNGKTKKSLIIVSILLIGGLSIYFIVQEIKQVINFFPYNIVTELNKKDIKLIEGEWHSNWTLYKSLIFKNENLVIGVNQKGDSVSLDYSLDAKTLSITDSGGLKLVFFIVQLTDDTLILRDIETMKDNIEFKRK